MVVVEREDPTCSRKKKKIPSLCRPVNRPIQRGCLHMGERTRHDVRVGLVEVEIVLVWTSWKAGRAQAEERLGLRGSKLDLVGERLKVMDWAIGPARERGGWRAEGGREPEVERDQLVRRPSEFPNRKICDEEVDACTLEEKSAFEKSAKSSQMQSEENSLSRAVSELILSVDVSLLPPPLLLNHDVVLQPKFRTFSTPTPTARPLRSFKSTATLLSSA